MNYTQPDEARDMRGLRLALTAHMPAPYSMSARAVLDHHSVSFVAVEQQGAGPNRTLLDWTGHRNAPVAVYENEAPRTGWLEILNLAERLGSGESLLPDDIDTRMQMIGMINELIGENGLVWNLRLMMLGLGGAERAAQAAESNPMYKDYGYSEEAKEAASARARHILGRFSEFAAPSLGKYLCGDRLSALDIYWLFFSNLVAPLPDEDCQMPAGLRKSYEYSSEVLGDCDPLLIEQRDFVLATHLSPPMTF